MSEQQPKGVVSEATIVGYSAMYMPVSMVLLPLGVYVLPYYVELGISLYTMSAIIFAARVSDAFTDPLIGVLSDKTKSRWGRRKPWIVGGAPLLMLSLYMLFVPSENPSAWYFGFWIVVLYFAFTIVDLPYFAWGAELSPLYEQRTKITFPTHSELSTYILKGLVKKGFDMANVGKFEPRGNPQRGVSHLAKRRNW